MSYSFNVIFSNPGLWSPLGGLTFDSGFKVYIEILIYEQWKSVQGKRWAMFKRKEVFLKPLYQRLPSLTHLNDLYELGTVSFYDNRFNNSVCTKQCLRKCILCKGKKTIVHLNLTMQKIRFKTIKLLQRLEYTALTTTGLFMKTFVCLYVFTKIFKR